MRFESKENMWDEKARAMNSKKFRVYGMIDIHDNYVDYWCHELIGD